jgi:hypothetical protein
MENANRRYAHTALTKNRHVSDVLAAIASANLDRTFSKGRHRWMDSVMLKQGQRQFIKTVVESRKNPL